MKNPLHERPWLAIVVALAAFVLVWSVFLVIAHRNAPATVPLAPARANP
jgi:hypothetical protein